MALPRRKRGGIFAVLVVVAVVASLLAAAPVIGATDDGTDYGNGYMIVELSSSPLAHNDAAKVSGRFDPTSRAYANALRRLEQEHARFLDRLARTAPEAEVVNEMFVTSNSVVLKLNGASPASIEAIGGVRRTNPSDLYYLDMDQSVGLIGVDTFWASIGGSANAGEGVKVGIIDSGINPDHPFFECKDVNFGGVYYSGVGILPGIPALPAIFGPFYIPNPGYEYDLDGDGVDETFAPFYSSDPHGTHVAGTVAGCETTIDFYGQEITLSGVAPGAVLYDYNVFPYFGAGMVAYGGSAFSHDIAAAIEDAVMDGMNVINMSLGGGVQGPHDFLAEASNAAVAAGVVVVTSAGNEGPGAYTVGSPGSAEDVIAVGASTNAHGAGAIIHSEAAVIVDIYAQPSEFPDFDGSPTQVADWSGTDNTACSSDGVGDHTDETVLISRGDCSFSQKVQNAKDAGAMGAIIYNNADGVVVMSTSPGFDNDLPAVSVTAEEGAILEGAAPFAGYVTAPTVVPATPNLLADFSSRGPAPFTNVVKPDVVAPGVDILSSVWSFGTANAIASFGFGEPGWQMYNGTSMASPHVAGAAAALLAVDGRDDWTPAMVKSALVTTANVGTPGGTVFEQGGGLVSLPSADAASTFFEPANASFGIFQGKKPASGTVEIAVTDDQGQGVTSCTEPDVSHEWVTARFGDGLLTVDFDAKRFDAPDIFYGGYVEISCGGTDYHIPWGAVVDRKG